MDLKTRPFLALDDQIVALDLHAGGEPIRLVVDGFPPVPGETMNRKRLYVGEHLDHLRLLLTQEPRGHRDMFGALLTDPVSEHGDFGLVFMDPRHYPYMCGHGTIGAVTAVLEMGWLKARQQEEVITVDAPAGPVRTLARLSNPVHSPGRLRVDSVSIELEAAFVFSRNRALDVPGWGRIAVDVAFAGGFGLLISSEQVGLPIAPGNAAELARCGMAAIEAANQQLEVQHPTRPYMDTVDSAEIYDASFDVQGRGKNAMIYGQAHVDRSACGTGTSVKMALLHHQGQLQVGETYVNEGILGTTFEGQIVAETRVGNYPAVVPQVRGSAHITGLHRFVLDPRDPFPQGFLL